MKRKLTSMLLAACMLLVPATVHAEDIDIYSMSLEELQEAYLNLQEKYNALLSESAEPESAENLESNADFEYSAEGFTYKYLKNEVKNISGEKYVFVFFEYTNDSGETSMPYYSINAKAYQNGIQIDPYMSIDEGIPEADIAYKEIKTGTTTDIAFKFKLSDDSPVSMEFQPMIAWGDTDVGEFTFELNL